jgi:hypothetical protein
MLPAGLELLVAARRDGVVPTVVVALGGVGAGLAPHAVVVPLPAPAARIARALACLDSVVDVRAVAALASRVGQLLLDGDYELIELNPVVGGVALDALACRTPALERTP